MAPKIGQFSFGKWFQRLESDHNVYINAHVIIAVYMDDLLIFAQGAEVFHWLKNILCEKNSMTDLGDVKFILGLQGTEAKEVLP
jgi:hypothetical protein